jgi:hypothetical protein
MKVLNRNQDFPEGCSMPGAQATVYRLAAPALPGRMQTAASVGEGRP